MVILLSSCFLITICTENLHCTKFILPWGSSNFTNISLKYFFFPIFQPCFLSEWLYGQTDCKFHTQFVPERKILPVLAVFMHLAHLCCCLHLASHSRILHPNGEIMWNFNYDCTENQFSYACCRPGGVSCATSTSSFI